MGMRAQAAGNCCCLQFPAYNCLQFPAAVSCNSKQPYVTLIHPVPPLLTCLLPPLWPHFVKSPAGVEMEALTAAAVAALTVYDMCKAAAKDIQITDLKLESKTGGKSADYMR